MYSSSIGNVVGRWFRSLLKKGERRAALGKLVHLLFGFHKQSWETETGLSNSSKMPSLAKMLNPFQWIYWLGLFIWEWLRSRPYSCVLPALPSVALGLVLVTIAYQARFQTGVSRQSQYRRMYDQAIDDERLNDAGIILSALIELNPGNEGLRYQKAILEEKKGDRKKAVELMERLVTSAKSPRAALWLISNEIDLKNAGSWDIPTHQKFRYLTGVALEASDSDSRIKSEKLLGSYLLAINAKKEAVKYLGSLAGRDPTFALPTAIVCNELGDRIQARQFAEIAASHFSALLAENPKSSEIRTNLAKALTLLEQEDQASQVLIEGFNLTKDETLKTLAGEAYVYRIRRKNNDNSSLQDRLEDSKRALILAPNSQVVMDEVIGLLFECRTNKNDAIASVRATLAQGLDPKAVHFVRGTLALFENRAEEAKKELEQASSDGNQMPGVLNNLAMAILKSQNPDLESALQMAELANQLLPNHAFLRDTRGQLLVKLKRYSDAIPDLEYALKEQELAKTAHAALAEAYRQLGNEELASRHETLSN
ncbi:MAG: tetratricopeptide repeat protein [Pirellulales bacterium]